MAVVIHSNGGGNFGGLFPSDYPNMKVSALGDSFPGWDEDIIPVCVSVSKSFNKTISVPPGTTNQGTINESRSINNKVAAKISSSNITANSQNAGSTASVSIPNLAATAYSIFLPYFYNFDFTALKNAKNSIRSMAEGNPTVWLER